MTISKADAARVRRVRLAMQNIRRIVRPQLRAATRVDSRDMRVFVRRTYVRLP